MKKAIYGFSGDPITYGHIDIIERALSIFGELTVGIGVNPAKKYFFSLEERRDIAEQSLKRFPNVRVIAFKGLLVDYAYENNFSTVIRGIRNSEDLNYEMMLHQVGESQKLNIDTIYFPARQELMHISSGAVKALQIEQGLIHEYVPLYTKQKLEERLARQFLIGITGEIGTGKTYISQQIKEMGEARGQEVHIINIDKIGHQILGELNEPIYQNIRTDIVHRFGDNLWTTDRFIDRKKLGQIIFNDRTALKHFNELLYKPLLLKLRREIYGKKGMILLDTALISESKMNYLVNNNIILVSAAATRQRERLEKRGYTDLQIENRMKSQYSCAEKERLIRQSIEQDCYGRLWQIDNSTEGNEQGLTQLMDQLMGYFKLA